MVDLEHKLTKEYIQSVLLREDAIGMHAVGRALILLNNRQTESEQVTKEVLRNNARGFTPADAQMGTDMANFYTEANLLTRKQLAYWRRPNKGGIPRICKYWKQIQEEAMLKHGITKRPSASKGREFEHPEAQGRIL
jgi:hypothetical protein